jgi:hypothetical protein
VNNFVASYNSLIAVRQTQIFNFLGVAQFLRLSRFVLFHFLGFDQNFLLLLLYFTWLLTAVKDSSFFNFSIGFLWLCGKWSIVFCLLVSMVWNCWSMLASLCIAGLYELLNSSFSSLNLVLHWSGPLGIFQIG